ncbi:MAG: hypothetical protein WAV93_11420 [Bacteroidales bacterium]
MNMTTTTVKPINTAAMRRANLGAAVKAWLESRSLTGNYRDEADIALEASLIANGALRSHDTIHDMYAAEGPTIHIYLDLDMMEVDTDGNFLRGAVRS